MKKTAISISLLLAAGLAWQGCTDPESDLPRLEFPANSSYSLQAGDTTEPLVMVKYSADVQGREQKNSKYESFHFVSSDTSVVKVVEGRRLLGVKVGSAKVDAQDDVGNASTKEGQTFSVSPQP